MTEERVNDTDTSLNSEHEIEISQQEIFTFEDLNENTEWSKLNRSNYKGPLYQPPWRRPIRGLGGRAPSSRPPRNVEEWEKLKRGVEWEKKRLEEKERIKNMIPMSEEKLDLIERTGPKRVKKNKNKNKKSQQKNRRKRKR